MKKSIIIGMITIFVLLLLSSCGGKAGAVNRTLEPPTSNLTQSDLVGKPAPDFHLNDMDGKPVSLSDFRGKPVLLNFWATWDPTCQAERPTIQQIYDEWQNKGLIALTVDILNSRVNETPSNLADFMGKNKYSFPVLLDVNQLATIKYHISSTPTNILIGKDGVIREIKVGAYPSKAVMEESLSKMLLK